MTVDINEDSRHCYELEKRSNIFLKEAESSNLKVFLLWIMNNYKRIEAVSSLKNYWRILRMHILDKTDRVFSESDKRDIRNVRNVLKSEETLTDRSISRSISNISRFSFVFVHFSWKNSSQIATICIFDSILTESLMIRYFRMSVSEFSISQKYLWTNSSIVDCALSSISTFEKFNTIFTKITLLHTKDEDNHSRMWVYSSHLHIMSIADVCAYRKTLIIDEENNHSLFCLLDHLLSLALIDKTFEAESIHDIKNIFWVKMSSDKQSLTLKWKRKILDLSVLRELMRDFKKFKTSSIKSLHVNIFARNLKRTRRKAELQDNLDQKYLRRDLLNVVNSTFFLSYLNSNFFFIKKC